MVPLCAHLQADYPIRLVSLVKLSHWRGSSVCTPSMCFPRNVLGYGLLGIPYTGNCGEASALVKTTRLPAVDHLVTLFGVIGRGALAIVVLMMSRQPCRKWAGGFQRELLTSAAVVLRGMYIHTILLARSGRGRCLPSLLPYLHRRPRSLMHHNPPYCRSEQGSARWWTR